MSWRFRAARIKFVRKSSCINHRRRLDTLPVFSSNSSLIRYQERVCPCDKERRESQPVVSVSPANPHFPRKRCGRWITDNRECRSEFPTLVAPLIPSFYRGEKKKSPPSSLSISNCRFSPWRPCRLNFLALCFTATAESADYR